MYMDDISFSDIPLGIEVGIDTNVYHHRFTLNENKSSNQCIQHKFIALIDSRNRTSSATHTSATVS